MPAYPTSSATDVVNTNAPPSRTSGASRCMAKNSPVVFTPKCWSYDASLIGSEHATHGEKGGTTTTVAGLGPR